jgi:amino acid transporter
MASLAQVAGQYVFLLVGAKGIGSNPASGWVLLVGILWIIAMTYICYRGIEVSANFQKVLLSIELVMLLVLSVTALVRVGTGHHPPQSVHPSLSWLNPFHIGTFQAFIGGLTYMLFIYWGWDTAVSVNEETKDKTKTPGQAAIISTVLLLVTYVLVIFSVLAFAGTGSTGIGLTNPANSSDVLSVMGSAIFGSGGIGTFLSRLLILMVLSSAAASTQTTILPTARTTLSMAAYKALPKSFARIHPRYLTPTVSTIVMGAISIGIYASMNYIGHGNFVILDAVVALGLYIAFYYGLTALSCVWYYRKTLTSSTRNLVMRGILPGLGWLIMWGAGGYTLWQTWDVGTAYSYTSFTMPWYPNWHVGGSFVIAFLAALAGVLVFIYMRVTAPAYFKKETLTRSTPTLVPDK